MSQLRDSKIYNFSLSRIEKKRKKQMQENYSRAIEF